MKKISLIASAIVFLFICSCTGPKEENKPASPPKAETPDPATTTAPAQQEEHVSGNITETQQDQEAAPASQGEHVSGSLSSVPTPHISGQ